MNQSSHIEDFESVLAQERERLSCRKDSPTSDCCCRRCRAGLKPGNPKSDAVGLALSGGGIRSATFCLGILQAFHRYNVLRYVDYLSTVSGGGYVGTSLTWFMSAMKQEFPFGSSRKDFEKKEWGIVRWLRAHGNVLTPGDGLNTWAFAAAVIAATLINLLIVVPPIVVGMRLLGFPPSFLISEVRPFGLRLPESGFVWLRLLGCLFGITLAFRIVVSALRIQKVRSWISERKQKVYAGRLLAYAAVFLAAGSLPVLYEMAKGWVGTIGLQHLTAALSGSGLISLAGGLFRRKPGSESKGLRSLLLTLGLTLLAVAVLLWMYHLASIMDHFAIPGLLPYTVVTGLIILFSGMLALLANINCLSMHRYYRNCLAEAYLPAPSLFKEGAEGSGKRKMSRWEWNLADRFKLHEVAQTAAPYHIINAAMNTIGSRDPKLRARGADNFILTPLYCGAASTDYRKTEDYENGEMKLATAMAISGAAVNPNMTATRSRPLTFLMTLLNLRLGFWIGNPRYGSIRSSLPYWIVAMIREMLGKGLNEKISQVHIADGGHFENLGLYELIRRKCAFIIVVDASHDPDRKFGDLEKAIRLARTDFGAEITLNDVSNLSPSPAEDGSMVPPCSSTAFVWGTIKYVQPDNAPKVPDGHILYIKPSLIEGINADLISYAARFSSFPHQSTGDQFFDEAQFEAYRELGFQIGTKLCEKSKLDDEHKCTAINDIFSAT